jgi:hypothetical protein
MSIPIFDNDPKAKHAFFHQGQGSYVTIKRLKSRSTITLNTHCRVDDLRSNVPPHPYYVLTLAAGRQIKALILEWSRNPWGCRIFRNGVTVIDVAPGNANFVAEQLRTLTQTGITEIHFKEWHNADFDVQLDLSMNGNPRRPKGPKKPKDESYNDGYPRSSGGESDNADWWKK